MSTAVTVAIPSNIELPARLRGADIAAQIAEQNAIAAGGIRTGGFPKISIKANKFHIIDGDEMTTLTAPAAPGQPPLPLMCLEIAVVAANPAKSKTFYAGEYVEGSKAPPDCQSTNGLTPDVSIAAPQNSNCANCPKAARGSAISKFSGKEISACSDSKQLAVLPAGDLNFKMLGWNITKGSLKNWGEYVNALSGRNMILKELVTNVTFDATANGVLQFGFNRYLTDDEAAKCAERAKGDDVKNIVQPMAYTTPQLPAPAVTPALAAPQPAALAPTPAPQVPATSPVAPAAAATFAAGATPPAPEEPAKRTRKPRATTPPAPAGDLSYLPPAIQAALAAMPADSPARAAILAQFPPPAAAQPAPAAPVVADPFAGLPPHVKAAVDAVGGLGTPAGDSVWISLTQKQVPQGLTAPVETKAAAPAINSPVQEAPVVASPASAPAAAAPNFGANPIPAPTVQTQPTAQVTAAGASLKELLQKKLGIAPGSATVQ